MEILLLLFPKTEKCESIVEVNSVRSGSLVKKLCSTEGKADHPAKKANRVRLPIRENRVTDVKWLF